MLRIPPVQTPGCRVASGLPKCTHNVGRHQADHNNYELLPDDCRKVARFAGKLGGCSNVTPRSLREPSIGPNSASGHVGPFLAKHRLEFVLAFARLAPLFPDGLLALGRCPDRRCHVPLEQESRSDVLRGRRDRGGAEGRRKPCSRRGRDAGQHPGEDPAEACGCVTDAEAATRGQGPAQQWTHREHVCREAEGRQYGCGSAEPNCRKNGRGSRAETDGREDGRPCSPRTHRAPPPGRQQWQPASLGRHRKSVSGHVGEPLPRQERASSWECREAAGDALGTAGLGQPAAQPSGGRGRKRPTRRQRR